MQARLATGLSRHSGWCDRDVLKKQGNRTASLCITDWSSGTRWDELYSYCSSSSIRISFQGGRAEGCASEAKSASMSRDCKGPSSSCSCRSKLARGDAEGRLFRELRCTFRLICREGTSPWFTTSARTLSFSVSWSHQVRTPAISMSPTLAEPPPEFSFASATFSSFSFFAPTKRSGLVK